MAARQVPSLLIQRKYCCQNHGAAAIGECDDCKRKRLAIERKPTTGVESSTVPPVVDEVLRSRGEPLDGGTVERMERRLGHDFGSVRIHTDSRAAESAAAVHALAYTVGRDIVFGSRQYSPSTSSGEHLLVHELTHVVQQRFGRYSGGEHLEIAPAESAREREAEAAVQSGHLVNVVAPASGLGLDRQPAGADRQNTITVIPHRTIENDHQMCLDSAEDNQADCQTRGILVCALLIETGVGAAICAAVYAEVCNGQYRSDRQSCHDAKACLEAGAEQRKKPSECGADDRVWPYFNESPDGDQYAEWRRSVIAKAKDVNTLLRESTERRTRVQPDKTRVVKDLKTAVPK